MQALTSFPNNLSIQDSACGALAGAAANPAVHHDFVQVANSIDAVVESMTAYPNDEGIITSGCECFRNLARSAVGREALLEHDGVQRVLTSAVADLGAFHNEIREYSEEALQLLGGGADGKRAAVGDNGDE